MQQVVAQDGGTLEAQRQGDAVRLVLAGAWTVHTAGGLEAKLAPALAMVRAGAKVIIDGQGVSRLDTVGALMVQRLAEAVTARQGLADIVLPNPAHQTLLDEARQLKDAEAVPPRQRPSPVIRALDTVGEATLVSWRDFLANASLFGAVVVALFRLVTLRGRVRFLAIVHQVDRVAYGAVPIILLITFLIGAIIAQQGIFHFRQFGADAYVVNLVGVLTLRELGVLIVSIMIAGRTGSAFTAELGSMKMREEIDALRVMGLNPIDVLVVPRVIALLIGLPILTLLGNIAALFGGAVVSHIYGDMPFAIFMQRLQDEVAIDHFWVGMIKAPFMALMIGLIACVEGLRVQGSAESLGLQTTASVVKATFMVIVVDGIFAMFFASIGM